MSKPTAIPLFPFDKLKKQKLKKAIVVPEKAIDYLSPVNFEKKYWANQPLLT
jgi:hypothetical protein